MSTWDNKSISGKDLQEKVVQKLASEIKKRGLAEVIAEALAGLDARMRAVEKACTENNLGTRIADSVDAQELKVGGEDVASAISGKASSTHTHGNITNDGKVGSTSDKPLITTTDGVVTTGQFGGSAGQFAEGNHTHNISIGITTQNIDAELLPNTVYTLEAGGQSINFICKTPEIHDLIVQRQNVVISGQGDARNILCDKQKYTIDGHGYPVFERVDLYELAKWKNRGDVINVGGEVAYDPWGDGYPMRITEYQAQKDANNKWYCTNINLMGFKYSSSEGSYWGNINHDDTTNKDFMEFTSY